MSTTRGKRWQRFFQWCGLLYFAVALLGAQEKGRIAVAAIGVTVFGLLLLLDW